MTPPVFVHMLPQWVDPHSLRGARAVMVDVLRASTTIVHALANGAAAVVPCETVEEAGHLRASLESGPRISRESRRILLGGERQGKRIDGFDLDNSPLAFTPEVVRGATIVFTTTNGTRALGVCREAQRILIGSFVNRAALVWLLRQDARPVHIVCAGTDGSLTAEDILFAGAVAAALMEPAERPSSAVSEASQHSKATAPIDLQTQMAIDFYRARSGDEATFRETLRASRGGRNLIQLGMDADIERAAQLDLFDMVPEWFPAENRIVPAGGI